ncbi:MAG: TolC family protein [Treponema sp.]|nr:TolC family protein [Treponema sp.]
MKKLLSILVLAVLATGLFAEELTVTVEQAVELAMQNNIQVHQAERTLASAERSNRYSWNSASPSINGSANLSIPLMETYGSKDMSVSVSGRASLSLTPSLYTSIRSAKLQLEQGQITYEDALRSVELNVRKIFYSLLLSEQTIETQKRSMEAAKRQYETNLAKYNRGQLSELDLFSSQVNYESKMPAVESQENQLVNSMESFKQLLGINRDVKLSLKGSLDGFANFDEEKVQVNLSEISAIKKLEKQIESAENQLLATRFTAYGPSISITYSIGGGDSAIGNVTPASDIYVMDPFTGLPMLKHTDESKSSFKMTNHSVSLGVAIPLDGYLPWSNGAMSIANQKDSLVTLKENLENQKRTTELSIENSLRTIRQAQSQMKSLEATASLAQKTYDLTQIAYNQGSRDLNSLRNAEDSLISAKTQLQSQNYTLVNAILELENTLGVPFGTLSK